MNLKNQFNHPAENFRLPYDSTDLLEVMGDKILSWFPQHAREYVVLCIGTDRSTGDALGPLAGTLFKEMKPKHLHVYGTLHEPIHAMNMEESIGHVKHKHSNPYIIAIDACLGRNRSIGHIIAEKGPLRPGAALNKALPYIGDISITSVVNISGFMEHSILQNTRLSFVMDMARNMAMLLESIDSRMVYSHLPTILPVEQLQRKRPI